MKTYKLQLKKNYIPTALPCLIKWTNALRSGQYQEGGLRLKDDNGYSPLGVLVNEQGRMQEYISMDFVGYYDHFILSEDDSEKLPDFHGISTQNPVFNILGLAGNFPDGAVVRTEDGKVGGCVLSFFSEGYTFGQVADVLEQLFSVA